MFNDLLQQVSENAAIFGRWFVVGLVFIVVISVIYIVVRSMTSRRPKPVGTAPPSQVIDVMSLGSQGPPATGPVLEFYNIPVRLVVVVIGPAGRVQDLPPQGQWEGLFDAIVPGLAQVVAAHRPMIRRWPSQPSSKGFAHQFFQHVRLPGDGGRGSPLSSAAGIIKYEGQSAMAGLVFRTEAPSAHGQEIINSEENWLRILRVRG